MTVKSSRLGSQFEETAQAIRTLTGDEVTVTLGLIGELINDKQSVLVRYRL